MSAPRTKRQFAGAACDPAQRHITSFFNSATGATSPYTHNHHNHISQTYTSLPSSSSSLSTTKHHIEDIDSLPASVQSNLLSVGMRVRKSVPEGYKTGSYAAFALWDESDAGTTETAAAVATAATMGEGQRSRANAFSSPRELLPFCGINKVGGMNTQPPPSSPSSTYQPHFSCDGMGLDDMPGLISSQESVQSSASSITGPSRKRYFVEDEENEIPGQLNFWRYHRDISPVSDNGRPIAVPRKSRLRANFSGGPTTPVSGAGHENLMVVDSDFDDAEFLDQGPWEVDMMNDA
ncbi:ribonucleotide reductase inhibitor-domain-containing protein [Astrocystis sublimbata]|nr:ribonucleotide reductase inhibitor-domain-containing protein [Astrocystis sublimbata]